MMTDTLGTCASSGGRWRERWRSRQEPYSRSRARMPYASAAARTRATTQSIALCRAAARKEEIYIPQQALR
jgi:hypothetical protein